MKILRELVEVHPQCPGFLRGGTGGSHPVREGSEKLRVPKFRADLWAAANVTVLALAQGIAFAAIAGLPVVYGIVSTAVAAMVAPFFAGSRHTILGPTNATAFMLFSFFSVNPALTGRWGELIPLLVLMVGLIATVGAVLRVADLLQYVSRSVLVGYISGAAVLIVANQLKPFLGLSGLCERRGPHRPLRACSLGWHGRCSYGLGLGLDWWVDAVGFRSDSALASFVAGIRAGLLACSVVFGSLIHFGRGAVQGCADVRDLWV